MRRLSTVGAKRRLRDIDGLCDQRPWISPSGMRNVWQGGHDQVPP